MLGKVFDKYNFYIILIDTLDLSISTLVLCPCLGIQGLLLTGHWRWKLHFLSGSLLPSSDCSCWRTGESVKLLQTNLTRSNHCWVTRFEQNRPTKTWISQFGFMPKTKRSGSITCVTLFHLASSCRMGLFFWLLIKRIATAILQCLKKVWFLNSFWII